MNKIIAVRVVLIAWLSIFIIGCTFNNKHKKCEIKIVTDKTKEKHRYVIAFKDLTSDYVKFGIYANVEKNDTLYYVDNYYYSIEPCK